MRNAQCNAQCNSHGWMAMDGWLWMDGYGGMAWDGWVVMDFCIDFYLLIFFDFFISMDLWID